MKLIIDIDKDRYKDVIESRKHHLLDSYAQAVANGTPIPDNATNGDVIKAMFPDAEIHIDGNDVFVHHIGFWIKYNIRWWNAPYQKGGKE